VDFLAAAGQAVWQVLPLAPLGPGSSPYGSVSAFAGNPLLVSPERLVEDGLLRPGAIPEPAPPGARCDYRAAREQALHVATGLARAFEDRPSHPLREEFEAFRHATPWLADYSLFMAVRESLADAAWTRWPADLRSRQPDALAGARRTLAGAITAHEAMQWAFDRQWRALLAHAHSHGISVLGDAPIFVAPDSADVWAHPELFDLAAGGEPRVVAGVPPDYFSATGQRWGNPLYRWEAHAASGFAWWRARVAALVRWVDRVRLDHFIGFVRHWEIPAAANDARQGHWRPGPGEALFRAFEEELGSLPFVAEDLGETGPDVEALRDRLGLPGMRVLQFAFSGDPENPYLPHRHVPNSVVYTGTHDNDTTHGWWSGLDEAERSRVREALGRLPGGATGDIAWDLIRLGMGSVAGTFVAPVQDVLSLGREARLNTPGVAGGDNWRWRLAKGQLTPALAGRLREAARATGRLLH
jgi:4-alpha-glucanotransferase